MKMIRTYKALLKRDKEYKEFLSKMESKLIDSCEFESGIENLIDDGLCLINVNTQQLAPLHDCISIIKKNGILTEFEFNKLSI